MSNLFNLLVDEATLDNKTLAIIVVAILFVALASFGGLFAYWIVQYNKTGSSQFAFTRYLPFELNRFRRSSKTRSLDLGWIILSVVLFVAPMIAFAIVQNQVSAYFLMVFTVFQGIVFALLLFTKLSNYKGHLALVSIFVGLQLLISILEFFYFGNTKYNYISSSHVELAYVNIAIIMIQMIFEFVLILNPTYKGWARMQQIGAETFNRPKYCYIAMLEWGTFLNMILNYIAVIIVTFF